MFNGISSYLPSIIAGSDYPKESKLDTTDNLCKAIFSNNFTLAQEIVQNGVNPALKDQHGFTAIDYAVFNGHLDQLPRLFNKMATTEKNLLKLPPAPQFEPKSTLGLALKDIISQLTLEKIHTEDYEFQLLENVFDQFSKEPIDETGASIFHFLAAFATSRVFKYYAEKHSELVTQKDYNSSSALFYAATNKDHGEEIFQLLVEKGMDPLELNIHGHSPLMSLAARIKEKDPLALSDDVLILLTNYFPGLIVASPIGTYLSFRGYAALAGLLFSGKNILAKGILTAIGYQLPALGMGVQAYIAYKLATVTFEKAQLSWKMSGQRPLRALVVTATNLLISTPYVASFSQSFFSTYKAGFYHTFKYQFNANWHNWESMFSDEDISTDYRGNAGLDIVGRLDYVGDKPGNIYKAAEYVMGMNGAEYCAQIKNTDSVFKTTIKEIHPDRNQGQSNLNYGELISRLKSAHITLKNNC